MILTCPGNGEARERNRCCLGKGRGWRVGRRELNIVVFTFVKDYYLFFFSIEHIFSSALNVAN